MVILKMLAYAALTLALVQAGSQGESCKAGLQIPEDQVSLLQAQVHVDETLDKEVQDQKAFTNGLIPKSLKRNRAETGVRAPPRTKKEKTPSSEGEEQEDQRACNDTVPVKGSLTPMPARGFITCCNPIFMADRQKMVESLQKFLSLGGRRIDTAPDYSVGDLIDYEEEVGQVVRESGVPRKELWISSKVQTEAWDKSMVPAKEWVLAQVDQSLTKMGLSYLDIMVLHYGPGDVALKISSDGIERTDWVDMWRGLMEAKALGKVLNIGVMATTRLEIEDLIHATGEAPAIVMSYLNPWVPAQQMDYVNWLQSLGITMMAYTIFVYDHDPVAWGQSAIKAAELAAQRYNVTSGQLVMQWTLDQGAAFTTPLYHDQYLAEDLPCLGFQTDAHDSTILGMAPKWWCNATLLDRFHPQIMPGCVSSSRYKIIKSGGDRLPRGVLGAEEKNEEKIAKDVDEVQRL